jgi:sugar lactone lactonase YvrE
LIRSFFCCLAISPEPDDGICANATWKTDGITMAGGNGSGPELNQLDFPSGIFLDDDSNLYIADGFNHRIVKWMYGSSSGQIIAGDNAGGNKSDQFHYPTSLTFDKDGTMFVVDGGNRRIQKWANNANQGETIISNISSWGVYIDNQNSLYYSDSNLHSILKWPENEVVAGGHGEGSYLNQLRNPGAVIVDQSDTVYVADTSNNRVVKWPKGATSGILVVGDTNSGSQANQLWFPSDLLFDRYGNLLVLDFFNYRIQKFTINKTLCDATNQQQQQKRVT